MENILKKCEGCGAYLQDEDPNKDGFTKNISKNLCERCFRIRNYSEYKVVVKDNDDYIKILKEINQTRDLVVFVVDVFLLNHGLEMIQKYLTNPILLVLTKRDLLPLSVKDEKLLSYMDNYNIKVVDKEIISSYKNYNFDALLYKIKKYQISKMVYVVGFTNAGKSTMINKLLYHYSNEDTKLTTSLMPSTTLNRLEVTLDETLTLVDTPGLLIKNSLMNYLDGNKLNKVLPKKEIKPITYQIKSNQWIVIDDFCMLEVPKGNDLTLYLSGALNVNRYYEGIEVEGLKNKRIKIKKDHDLVLEGLGFIHFKEETSVTVYTKYDMDIYTRKKLI